MADASRRTVCWRPIWNKDREGMGLEHLLLARCVADSVVLAFDEQRGPFRLTYRLTWDDSWRLRAADLVVATERLTNSLSLRTDGQGEWRDGQGRAIDRLDGCVDIDIWPTPFTNSFPIRREPMDVGERRQFRMAWVFAPDLTLHPQPQAYTRLADRRYLFENLDGSGFAAQLTVDDDGIVLDYPNLFRRVPSGQYEGTAGLTPGYRMKLQALVIIDMQQCMASPAAGARNNPDAEQNIAALLGAWRRAGGAVVHVRHISRQVGSPFWPGQPGVEFQQRFAPLPGEHIVEKNVPDALINSGLERWLRVRGIVDVVIVGVSTNNSVEATARTAGNLGFNTRVVSDATFAFDKVDYAGVKRTAEEVHAMALANLDGEYATVTSTERLLEAL